MLFTLFWIEFCYQMFYLLFWFPFTLMHSSLNFTLQCHSHICTFIFPLKHKNSKTKLNRNENPHYYKNLTFPKHKSLLFTLSVNDEFEHMLNSFRYRMWKMQEKEFFSFHWNIRFSLKISHFSFDDPESLENYFSLIYKDQKLIRMKADENIISLFIEKNLNYLCIYLIEISSLKVYFLYFNSQQSILVFLYIFLL